MLPEDRRKFAGFVLIAVGIALFFLQYADGYGDAVVFLAIGSAFLFGYFSRKTYGLLIPGCILLGLGLGRIADMMYFPIDDPSAFGLGIGFVAIFLIDRFYRGSNHWWPLIPGGILIFTALAESYDQVEWVVERGWPLLLALFGVLLVLGVIGRPRDRENRRRDDDAPRGPIVG